MSSLIEYCIELNQVAEPVAPQDSATGPRAAPGSLPPPAQRPKLRRQSSVVCSRIQHLSTIDYVEDGEHRVSPEGGEPRGVCVAGTAFCPLGLPRPGMLPAVLSTL